MFPTYNQTLTIIKNNKYLVLSLLVFGSLYASISLVNHYNFRTFGYDLGIYNNALYDYSQFKVNDNPVMHRMYDNILGDHLSLYHLFFAPLRYIFGTWTLLIIQIISILFGAIGIHRLIEYLSKNKQYANLATVHFLSMWGIFSALAYDYHDNVVAAMFVPWLILSVLQKNTKVVIIWTIIILISKENVSLWLAFVYAGLFLLKYDDKELRKTSIIGATLSFIYFVLALKVIMPALQNTGTTYSHIKSYSALGNSMGEYIVTLLTKPQYVMSLMFENQSGDPTYNGIKFELHWVVLLSGGFVFFKKPQFLVMLIPIYMQKMLNDSYGKWGINLQYSIEFAPILTFGFFYWIIVSNYVQKHKKIILIAGTALCLITSIAKLDSRTSKWYDSHRARFWQNRHYSQTFDVKQVYRWLEMVPKNAKVCAQNLLVPHLAFRDHIYTYPHTRDAEYIIVMPNEGFYPADKHEFDSALNVLRNADSLTFLINEPHFIMAKKKDK